MKIEPYKKLTLEDIDERLNWFGLSEETIAKVMDWAEKKAIADYIKGEWKVI